MISSLQIQARTVLTTARAATATASLQPRGLSAAARAQAVADPYALIGGSLATFTLSLNFSDARNSGFVAALAL